MKRVKKFEQYLVASKFFFFVYQRVHYKSLRPHLTSSLHHLTATHEGGGANILAPVGTSWVRPVGYVVTVEEHLRVKLGADRDEATEATLGDVGKTREIQVAEVGKPNATIAAFTWERPACECVCVCVGVCVRGVCECVWVCVCEVCVWGVCVRGVCEGCVWVCVWEWMFVCVSALSLSHIKATLRLVPSVLFKGQMWIF